MLNSKNNALDVRYNLINQKKKKKLNRPTVRTKLLNPVRSVKYLKKIRVSFSNGDKCFTVLK
jgi:hypothetical protein